MRERSPVNVKRTFVLRRIAAGMLVLTIGLMTMACVVDLSSLSPMAQFAREYLLGVLLVLCLTCGYAYYRSKDAGARQADAFEDQDSARDF